MWELLRDGRHWDRWNGGIDWMAVDDELRAGRYITVKPKRGRQTALRILEADPPRALALLLRFGPLAQLRIDIILDGDETETTLAAVFTATGLASGPLVRRLAASLAERTGDDFERLLELALA